MNGHPIPGPLVVLGCLLGGALLLGMFRLLDWVETLVTRGEGWDETETWERFGSGEWR